MKEERKERRYTPRWRNTWNNMKIKKVTRQTYPTRNGKCIAGENKRRKSKKSAKKEKNESHKK